MKIIFLKNFIKHASNAIKLNLVSDAKYFIIAQVRPKFIKSIIEDNLNKRLQALHTGGKISIMMKY